MDIGAREIRVWHVRDNGWEDIGYHYVIRRNGEIEVGRPERLVGSHVAGHNHNSLGICLVGGIGGDEKPNFTKDQYTALRRLLTDLQARYPKTVIQGHRDFPGVTKECPCFDVGAWWLDA